jgi:hypothetical protein
MAGRRDRNGYITIRVDQVGYRAHRLAVLYMTGQWPEHDVDHHNGQRDDNRWENLRAVTTAQNRQNLRAARSDSTTGLLGVCLDRTALRNGHKPYLATIGMDGRQIKLGRHATAEEAHAAYVKAKRALHSHGTL